MFVNSFDSAFFFQKDSSNQKKNYLRIPYLLIPNKNIKIDSNEEQLICLLKSLIVALYIYLGNCYE